MKRIFKIFSILVLIFSDQGFSQNISDGLNYSSNSIDGTARFNSMSGAFGALGGDLSCLLYTSPSPRD